MHLVYSLNPEISGPECVWLDCMLPLVNGLRYWHSEYSSVTNKYLFTVILTKEQSRVTDAILARHGVADYTVQPKQTGLVTCFPNH